MNQNDFRALLSAKTTARDGASGKSDNNKSSGSGSFGGKRNMTESDLDEIRRLSKKPKKKGSKKPSKSKTGDNDNDADASSTTKIHASGYRDRAAERRQGLHSDMIDANEFAHFDAEQTKFLGGDVEHTHLVKGLDFALLSQLKREKAKLLAATTAHKQQQQQQQTSSASTTSQATAPTDKLAFKTRIGRLVYFHAVQSVALAASTSLAAHATEHFLPGRMYYTFALGSGSGGTSDVESVPVVVQRSKDDCPEPDEVVSGLVSELVIANVGAALRGEGRSRKGKRTGDKKLRRKKKNMGGGDSDGRGDDDNGGSDSDGDGENGTAVTPAAVESDDEDIFPEVGEYVPIHKRDNDDAASVATDQALTVESHRESTSNSSTSAAGYFANLSASLSAAEQIEKQRDVDAEQAWKQTIRKVVATQSQAEREQKIRDEQRSGAVVDEYSECYPEYQAGASALDSEDDEEAPRKDKDADDDAEAAATEKTRRRKQKHGNKLQSDLEKITKLLDAKKTAAPRS